MPDTSTADTIGLAARARPYVQAYVKALRRHLPEWLPAAFVATAEGLERARERATGIEERQRLVDLEAALRRRITDWTRLLEQSLVQEVDQDLAGRVDEGVAPALRPGREPALSLLDDDAIDIDIALSRLGQVVELEAEAALRDLAARCSRLRGLVDLDPDANPMRPAVVASALRRASADFGLDASDRLLLLRELAPAVGSQLARVYARQLERLTEWGVEPSGFRRSGGPPPEDDAGAGEGATAAPAPDAAVDLRPPSAFPVPTQAQRARSEAGGGAAASAPYEVLAGALRKLAARDPERGILVPDELMARLLSLLLSRVSLTDGARRLIHRLGPPARRLAVTEPELWQQPRHPLWQLLDRLASAGTVFEGADFTCAGAAGAALDEAITKLEQTDPPDASQIGVALAAMDGATHDLLNQEAARVAPQAEAMQARMASEDIERRVREQLAERAHPCWVPAGLRQFLVGPWTTVLAHSAHTHGLDSERVAEQSAAADEMLELCRRARRQPMAPEVFTRCMTHARLGLTDAGIAPARIEAELLDLGRVLRKPWPSAGAQAVDWDSDGSRRRHVPAAPEPESVAAELPETAHAQL
ncbi:MAG: DUF1631 family protein, partial [Burkholderiales bacterium]|nr:DUF1631 family protein [Burkholderiales bacterium]